MRQRPEVSKIMAHFMVHKCFISERYHQGQSAEREDTCLWLMPTSFMSNRKS